MPCFRQNPVPYSVNSRFNSSGLTVTYGERFRPSVRAAGFGLPHAPQPIREVCDCHHGRLQVYAVSRTRDGAAVPWGSSGSVAR